MTNFVTIMYIILILKLFTLFKDINAMTDQCYDSNRDFYPYKGTKTAYKFVRGSIERPNDTCQPLQIWIVGGPGVECSIESTTFSELKKLQNEIVKNHEQNRGQLCSEDMNNLRNWNITFDLFHDKCTNESGNYIFGLAKRLKKKFPELLRVNPGDFNKFNYKFLYYDLRSIASENHQYFAKGLVGDPNITLSKIEHKKMYFFSNCLSGFINHIKATNEYNQFLSLHDTQIFLQNISQKFGFYNKLLDYRSIDLMFEMCVYELALDLNLTWCTLFKKEEMEFYEYAQDLLNYYAYGTVNDWSRSNGYNLLAEMIINFTKLEKENSKHHPKGVFSFQSRTASRWMLAALGVSVNHPQIRATNFNESKKRDFRSSLLMPFGSNVIAVFYRCRGVTPTDKVMFYANEKIILLPYCEHGLCDWELFKQKILPYSSSCIKELSTIY